MSSHSGRHGVDQYRTVERVGAVAGADKLRLVQLMMQGAKDRIAHAKGHIQRGEVSKKGEQIGRAIQLIDGLRASLDRDEGADIATNLERLYDYMIRRLLEANVTGDVALLDEIADLIGEVKSAWDELTAQAQALVESGAVQASATEGAR